MWERWLLKIFSAFLLLSKEPVSIIDYYLCVCLRTNVRETGSKEREKELFQNRAASKAEKKSKGKYFS